MMMNDPPLNCKLRVNVANCKRVEVGSGGGMEVEVELGDRQESGHQGAKTVSKLIGMILSRRPPRLSSYSGNHSLDNV